MKRSPYLILLFFAVQLTAVAAATASGNLLRNSSFEILDDEGIPVGWNASGNGGLILVEPADAQHGKACVHFQLEGQATRLDQTKLMALHPGNTYTLSAYVKTQGLDPATGFQLQLINVGWTFGYQSMLPINEANSDWKRYTKTFVVPAADAHKYEGAPNVQYQVVMYANKAHGSVWVDALKLEESAAASDYEPMEGVGSVAGVTALKPRDFQRSKYFQVKKPLFKELLSGEQGPRQVLYYGYNDLWAGTSYRSYAKKFGYRFVLDEQVKELRSHPFVPMTNGWPRGGVGSYPTARMILRPDVQDVAPKVFGDNPWVMDPRWQDAYVKAAIKLAEQSKDTSPANTWGNTWALWAGDEVFESLGNKVVPKDKRYDEVQSIDRDIRERFGFGKYGMPESQEDTNPFARIAFARWVNARLTDTYKKTYELVKKANPRLLMIGPDPCGAVPPVDLEAMTPYFDIVTNQSWYAASPFTQQLATGADTKATVDLSACPVWALVQHANANDPEALREQFSQVYRNGGQGLVILGVEWYDRELEHPKFINPAKWRALLEITDTVTKMNKLKLPKPDTAILYASDTLLALDTPKMADAEHPQMYAAYAALGPGVGSWFSFVSDRQIDRDQKQLKDYKVLYIPLATYERSAVLEKIEQYVKQGGIVVCADPTAFTWDINGESLAQRWDSITGATRGKPRQGDVSARLVNSSFVKAKTAQTITLPDSGVSLSPLDASVKPFAAFPDGSPAATIRRCGKGTIIAFASNPFASTDRSSQVVELVKQIQLAAGARTNHDIWRFKLPPFQTVAMGQADNNVCLTGNSVTYDGADMKLTRNQATGGSYTYDHFPTGLADAATTGDISFDWGHLTNRKQAYATRKRGYSRGEPALEKWIVSWKDRAPVSITIDLKRDYVLDRVQLIYSGTLPDVRLSVKMDGQSWNHLASYPAQPPSADVMSVAAHTHQQCRYLRFEFAERKTDAPMELSEVEIWGEVSR